MENRDQTSSTSLEVFPGRKPVGDAVITVIIPFYNEEAQVFRTLSTTRSILEKLGESFEILAIDDGSSDGTWKSMKAFSAGYSDFYAARFSRNFGKEAAVCAGLALARGDAAVLMDGDLQHPPHYIPEMVQKWREGYDVVEGVKSSRGRESFFSRAAANGFYGLFKRMSSIDLKDASDFKLLDRKVIDAWNTCPETDTFFRALSSWLGFRRTFFTFDVEDRTSGTSKWGFRKLVGLSINAITGFSSRPLMWISGVGAACLLFFFVLAIQTLIRYFSGNAASGFTTVILLQLFIGSLVLISLGLIGLYLGNLVRECKQRPRYIVSEMTGRREQKKSDDPE